MLKQCVESILALSLRPYEREIILVDDGSETPQLEGLSDCLEDILYIRQKNEGLSAARNTGLRAATGTFIQFVDGDDMLISNMYEHCLDIARFQSADMVMFDFSSSPKPTLTYNVDEPLQGAELMRQQNIRGSACGYLFRRAILGDLRFTKGIFHEDEEFTPQLLLRAEAVFRTDAKAYFYRERTGSITTDKSKQKTEKRLADLKDIILRLHMQADRMPTADRKALERRVAQLTMDYIYKIIVETRDRKFLLNQLEELRSKGLFPLPDRNYTKKYTWFRRMTNSTAGIRLLMLTLPYMKRER